MGAVHNRQWTLNSFVVEGGPGSGAWGQGDCCPVGVGNGGGSVQL